MRPSALLCALCLLVGCSRAEPLAAPPPGAPPTPAAPPPRLPPIPEELRAVHVIGAGRAPRALAVAPGPAGQRPAFASLDEDGLLRIAAGAPLEVTLPERGVRLFAAGGGTAFVVALANAQGAFVWTPTQTRRIGAFLPCAIEVAGGVTWIAGARPPAAPDEPDAAAELVLFALGDPAIPSDEPLGVAQGVSESAWCGLAAAPDGRLAVTWLAGDGTVRAALRDARGRGAAAPQTIATREEHATGGAIAWRRDGFVVGFVPKATGAPVLRPLAGGPERVLGARFDGPAGDLALRALPDGGLAAAWHRAHVGIKTSPTELVVAELGPDDALRQPPRAWLSPLAVTRGPAVLLIDGGRVVAGGVAQVEGDRSGWFLTAR